VSSHTAPGLDTILADLVAEHADLDRIVASLDAAAWETATPAEGWAVRDQVAHLAYFDGEARRAIVDPEGFGAALAEIAADPEGWMAHTVERGRAMSPAELLSWWRTERVALLAASGGLDPKARIAWYGPPMSALSFLSARLMETWIHGQDVVDGLHVERVPTARLRHVAHIAVRARAFNYAQRGRAVPETEVRVELNPPAEEDLYAQRGRAVPEAEVRVELNRPAEEDLYAQRGRVVPEGEVRVELIRPAEEDLRARDSAARPGGALAASVWSWGPADVPDRVTGDALDFCLVTTQRRHIADTDLAVEGPLAAEWMAIAQAFAGPPGPGRRPGQFPKRAAQLR
jgi:uncharacterized protein (TIGR03084 family)